MNMPKRVFPDWDQLYRDKNFEAMPWFHPVLDPDLDHALSEYRISYGTVLDLGTGPGTQAMALAERGFEVIATDISETAVKKAALEAKRKGMDITFIKDDVLDSRLEQQFDLIFDRGCLNVLPVERRQDYKRIIYSLIKPGGFLFLKCLSHLEERDRGPHLFSPDDVKKLFGPRFRILSIEQSVMQGTITPPPKVYFCAMQKSV